MKPLLVLETGLNPRADGIGGVSQLATWFWCSNDGVVPVAVSLNGWTAQAEAHVTQLTWTVVGPDGTIVVTADDCGSEPDPDSNGETAAATWIPNLPGDYTITLTATWGGQWTRSFGGASQTFDFEPVPTTMEPIAYHVVEIQTVGRPSD